MPIDPAPPFATLVFPWDDAAAPDPVVALNRARQGLGDIFAVRSGDIDYLFVFSAASLADFFALAERDASKGLADYRMLVRKLPDELFTGRRTFAHDLFGRDDVDSYLVNLEWAIERQIDELGASGTFDVFELARRVGHRVGLACWMGREAPVDALIAELDVLDGAEAFVHPERTVGADQSAERVALARVEHIIAGLLAASRTPSFLDDIAARWEPGDSVGIARDVILLHVATMTNLFAALGWTLAQALLFPALPMPTAAPLDACALESIRMGQRSIMLREVLRPIRFAGYALTPSVQIATMVPLTNGSLGEYDPTRWQDRALHRDVTITTFGHGSHRCPAQRFSLAAIVRTVQRLLDTYEMTPRFEAVRALPQQIGGVARAADPCLVDYRAR